MAVNFFLNDLDRVDVVDHDNSSAVLEWTEVKWDGGPLYNYVVQKKKKQDEDWVDCAEVLGNETTAKVPDLVEGGEYEFRVMAVNMIRRGPARNSKMTMIRHKKLVPQIMRTYILNKSVNSGDPIFYDVEIRGEPPPTVKWFRQWVEKDEKEEEVILNVINVNYNTKLDIKQAERGMTGDYRIVAENEHGKDEVTLKIIVFSVPSKPEGPIEVTDVLENSCKLSWKKPEDNGGKAIESYEVDKLNKATGEWEFAETTHDTEAEVQNLVKGGIYLFRVRAVNAIGKSENLENVDPTIAINPWVEPDEPRDVQVADNDNESADIKWVEPRSDGNATILKYIIQKRPKGGQWEDADTAPGSARERKVKKLTEGVPCQFRVIAVNKGGNSEPSEPTEMIMIRHKKLKPFIFRTNLTALTVKVGEAIYFDVKVQGEPPPTVTWFQKSGGEEKELEEYVTNVDYNTKLDIQESVRTMTGTYRILAKNDHGTDEAEVEVQVLSVPSKPVGPIVVSEVLDETCKLAWKKPEDNGGMPLKNYEVELRIAATDEWKPVGTTDERGIKVTGLQRGTSYEFRVRAVNQLGKSENLVTDGFTIAKNPWDVPEEPLNVEVADHDNKGADIKWEPPKYDGNATILNYIIQKKPKGGEWTDAGKVSGEERTFKITDLPEGSKYQFRVIAVNKGGRSGYSDPTKIAIIRHKKLKPYIVRTSIKPKVVTAGEPIFFDIDVKGEPPPTVKWFQKWKGVEKEVKPNVKNVYYNTKLDIQKAVRSMSGIYRILAENAHGKDEANVKVTVFSEPSKPVGPLKITEIFEDSCKLAWRKPEDNGGKPIKSYEVEKRDIATGVWELVETTSDTELEVKGLKKFAEYEFRVRAVNELGKSPDLEGEHSIIAKNPWVVPEEPLNVHVVDHDNKRAVIKWEPPKYDGNATILNYIIQKKPKGGEWVDAEKVSGSDTTVNVTDLPEGSEYQFRVIAVNKGGKSEASQSTKNTIIRHKELKPYIIPNNLKEKVVRAGEPIFFDVNIAGEPPPTVKWFHKWNGEEQEVKKNVINVDYNTKLDIKQAQRSMTGTYRIVAKNKHGQDEAPVRVTVFSVPSIPGSPLSVTNILDNSCKLTWKEPQDNGGKTIKKYEVEIRNQSINQWEQVGIAYNTEIDVKNLKRDEMYEFRVRAVNELGPSENLNTDEMITARNPWGKPDKAESVKVDDHDNQSADIKWEPPKFDGNATILNYIIQKKPKGGEWVDVETVPGTQTKCRINDLPEGSEYQFRVIAVNKDGNAPPSESTTMTMIRFKKLKPHISRSKLKAVAVDAGERIFFDVNIKGEPPPTVHWYHEWNGVKQEVMENIKNVNYNTKLDIKNSVRAMTGTYRILAKNDHGTDEAAVKVVVYSKPTNPVGPIAVSGVTETSCKLSWKKPEDNGGKPIKSYEVEILNKTTNEWMSLGNTSDTNLEVNSLQKFQDYKFRVKAFNELGESNYLQTDRFTRAKNPFYLSDEATNVDVTDHDNKAADLKWEAPLSDGGAPIERYIIQKKLEDGVWDYASEVSGKVTTGKVKGLKEGSKYQFRVIAVNKMGQANPSEPTKLTTIRYKALKPSIDRTKLKDLTVNAGKPIFFDVDVKGEPVPTVQWFHKWKLEKEVLDNVINVNYNTKLDIKDSVRGDTGTYRIVATNKHGKDEANVQVNVLSAPGIPGGSLKYSDVSRDSGKLSWQKTADDGGIEPLYLVEMLDLTSGEWKTVNKVSGTEVEVKNLKEGETYEFRVRTINRMGESENIKTDQPVVKANVSPIIDRTNLKDTAVNAGEPLFFDVNVQGDPEPTVQWFHKWKGTETEVTRNVINIPHNSKLDIMNPVRSMTGTYRILATNLHGTDEAVVNINVFSAPSKAKGPLKVSEVTKENCKLAWKTPDDDGGKPIKGYVVEKRSTPSGSWESVGMAEDTKTVVTGLVDGEKYEFRVRAINEVGESENLSTDSPVVASTPYGKYILILIGILLFFLLLFLKICPAIKSALCPSPGCKHCMCGISLRSIDYKHPLKSRRCSQCWTNDKSSEGAK